MARKTSTPNYVSFASPKNVPVSSWWDVLIPFPSAQQKNRRCLGVGCASLWLRICSRVRTLRIWMLKPFAFGELQVATAVAVGVGVGVAGVARGVVGVVGVAWGLVLTSTLWARRSLHAAEAHNGSRSICGLWWWEKETPRFFDLQFCPGGMYILLDWCVLICRFESAFCLNMCGTPTDFLAPFPFHTMKDAFQKPNSLQVLLRFELCILLLLLGRSLICRESPSTFASQQALMIAAGELADDVSLASLLLIICWALWPFREVRVSLEWLGVRTTMGESPPRTDDVHQLEGALISILRVGHIILYYYMSFYLCNSATPWGLNCILNMSFRNRFRFSVFPCIFGSDSWGPFSLLWSGGSSLFQYRCLSQGRVLGGVLPITRWEFGRTSRGACLEILFLGS